jgi:hypothetical protein
MTPSNFYQYLSVGGCCCMVDAHSQCNNFKNNYSDKKMNYNTIVYPVTHTSLTRLE